MIEEILRIMPRFIAEEIVHLNLNNSITEIRIRSKNKIIVICSKNEFVLDLIASPKIILDILLNVSKMSIYAIQTDLNNGFVVIRGGHRIGVCGEIIYENNEVISIKNINSMNIRIAKEKVGVARKIMPYIINENMVENTLIVSPPGMGKTTLLRDIARYISDGVYELGFNGINVGIVDERSEIAASAFGDIILDVGMRTDVISNVSKSKGMEMIVRSMGIKVVITDEIGSKEDIEAIKYAVTSGVKCIFTMHGKNLEDIMNKNEISSLIKQGIFENVIVLSNKNGIGTIENIHKVGKNVYEEVG